MNQVEVKRHQIEAIAALIGLVTIIIWGKMLGDHGITYLMLAVETVGIFLTLTAGCLADSLGRLLRMRKAKAQYKNIKNMKRQTLILHGTLGLTGSVICAALALLFARNVFEISQMMLILLVLSPFIFLRTVTSVWQGYFLGEGSELPVAVCAPLRQVLLLGFGCLFGNLLKNYGMKVSNLLGNDSYTAMYTGVGIAIAFCLTECFIALFLGLILLGNRSRKETLGEEGLKKTDSFVDTAGNLWNTRGMGMLIWLLTPLCLWTGAVFCRKSMQDADVFAEHYGVFVGKYLVYNGFLMIILSLLILPGLGKSLMAFKKADGKHARLYFQGGLTALLAHGIFWTTISCVLAEQIAGMLDAGEQTILQNYLRFGALLVILTALSLYLGYYLYQIGKTYFLLGSVGCVDIVFVIALSLLLNAGGLKVDAMMYAVMIGEFVFVLLTGFMCIKFVKLRVQWLQTVAFPLIGAAIVGLCSYFIGKFLTPHLGYGVTAFLAIILSALLYWVILLFLKTFKETQLKYIPGGNLIRQIGKILGIYASSV